MPTDRLYQDIVRTLRTEKLDDATFEKIAVRIANSYGVPVLPMPGGQDAGYDGAIVDADGCRLPGALVATMQKDGLANLRKNLRMHSNTYPEAAKTAFFVTTRPKTPRQKQNLTNEAQKVGYTLLGPADESAVAEYLFYIPTAATSSWVSAERHRRSRRCLHGGASTGTSTWLPATLHLTACGT